MVVDGTVTNDASQTLGLTGGTSVSHSQTAAAGLTLDSSSVTTFNIDQNLTNTLGFKVDGGGVQTVTLKTGSLSAGEVAAEITTQLTSAGAGATAYVDNSGHVQVQVTATGTGHSIQIVAGGANTVFGLGASGNASATSGGSGSTAQTAGANEGSAATFNIDTNFNQLDVAINGAPAQTITLTGGATQTKASIVNDINSQLTGGMAYVDGNGKIAIASLTTGLATPTASSVAVAGNAAATLGFSAATATGADATSGYTIGAGNDTLTFSIDGSSAHVTLTHGTRTAAQVAGEIATQLTTLGVTAGVTTDNTVKISSGTLGASSNVTISASTNDAAATLGLAETSTNGSMQDVGFGTGGATFTTADYTVGAPNANVVTSGGATSASLSFTPLANGADDQAITVSATNSSGQLQTKTIMLANSGTTRTGASIDAAIQAINTALQQTNLPTLQSVVAVKDDSTGTEKINFVSSLAGFQVSVGSTGDHSGVGGVAAQGTTVTAGVLAGGSTLDVSTKQGGTAAIAAVTSAVTALGSAQANVGKAQNTLNYAIGLAESQMSNLAAAESRVRDADMASEAANLTKAQVLQQSAIAAMVQANSAPQAVLTLLRG